MPIKAAAPAAAAAGAGAAGSAAATTAALAAAPALAAAAPAAASIPSWVTPAISAGASLASGLAQGLLSKDDQSDRGGHTPIPGGSVGGLGSHGRGGPMFSGRPDMAVPQRQSMAMQLLGGYR